MDPSDSKRLESLTLRQSKLSTQVHSLLEECRSIEQAINSLQASTKEHEAVEAAKTPPQSEDSISSSSPPPLPTSVTTQPQADAQPETPQSPQHLTSPPPKPEPSIDKAKPRAKKKPQSIASEIELNLGKTWLVRLGVGSLLTGLVFLSTYAYKNWLFDAPASLKVCCFMLLSLGLTGTGLYFEKAKENLVNYWRVVSAGGLAAGYYTLYAAHFTESLQCILNPILAGALLTAWAGIILIYACWKRSQTVSIMAIGLAFYGTIVNPAGWLSLFSAIVLSASGMFLLTRYQWSKVGLVTVITAYISHAFWLGFYPHEINELTRFSYLVSYWVLFACATSRFASSHVSKTTTRLITAINNGATWTLSVFVLPLFTHRPEIGITSLGIGGGFLLCAALSSMHKVWPRHLSSIYLYQGLFLATLGLMLEATGYYRFLLLAAEAIMLLLAGRRLKYFWLIVSSVVVYACSLGAVVYNIGNGTPNHIYLVLTMLSLIYAGIARKSLTSLPNNEARIALFPAIASWILLYFGVLGGLEASYALGLMSIIAAFVWTSYLLCKKSPTLQDFATLAPFVALMAFVAQASLEVTSPHLMAYFSPLIFLGFWFTAHSLEEACTQTFDLRSQPADRDLIKTLSWTFSIATTLSALYFINTLQAPTEIFLTYGGLFAITSGCLYQCTKRFSILIPGQVFHVVAITNITSALPGLSTLPFIWIAIHFALSEFRWGANSVARNLLAIASTIALYQNSNHPEISLTFLGLGLCAYAYWRRDTTLHVLGGLSSLALAAAASTLPAWVFGTHEILHYLPMVCFVTLAAIPQIQSTKPLLHRYQIVLTSGVLLLTFISVSLHVLDHFDGNGLAISWALLAAALFSLGLLMQCRSYRLVGLLWLAASLVHVVTIDVMQLNTLGRILSFITIGLILMALGYLYNRFQERIQKFL